MPAGETVTAVGMRHAMQCIAFAVYEEYAWAWGKDAKQDVLREEKIRHRRGTLGLREGQVIAASSVHLQRASLPMDFTDVG